jgi:hypothetical protein
MNDTLTPCSQEIDQKMQQLEDRINQNLELAQRANDTVKRLHQDYRTLQAAKKIMEVK